MSLDELPQTAAPPPTRRVRSRRAAIRAHRWTGWFLLLWVVFESLTGGYLVVGQDLQRWIDSDRYEQTAGDVGPTAAVTAAQAAVEQRGFEAPRARYVGFPHAFDGVYFVEVQDAAGEHHDVFVDPGTGHVNAVVAEGRSIYSLVERLHADFNRNEILGVRTSTIIGWLALLWGLNLIVGFRASRAHRRTLRHAVRVRRSRGRFTFHLDLHKLVGLVVVVPLLVLVVTGLAFEFTRQADAVVNAITPGDLYTTNSKLPFSKPVAGAKRVGLDAVQSSIGAAGLGSVQAITVPLGNPAGVFAVEVDGGGYSPYAGVFSSEGRTLEVYLDQYSAQVMKVTDPDDRSVGQQIREEWMGGVHFGSFGSWISRLVWVVAGLGTAVLAFTAVRMRLVKWDKRRRRDERSREPDRSLTADVPVTPLSTPERELVNSQDPT